jgi:hypothetical protein
MNIALLLADPSPRLRLLVLEALMGRPSSDPEVRELENLTAEDPIAAGILSLQQPDGSWSSLGGPFHGGKILATSLALSRLGYIGCDSSHPAVTQGAEFLFSRQRRDGSWPLSESYDEEGARYSMIPLQTAFPLSGLARCGFARDARSERAFDWLLSKRLPDGAWPTGIASGVLRYVGGYRRLPHSRWGCRSNTTACLICFARHPERRNSPETRRALDHLLARETRDAVTLGFETARLLGFSEVHGYLTFHAAFDAALMLDLCARMGLRMGDDERVDNLVEFIQGLAGPEGLWEYAPNPRACRWISFDIMRSLMAIHAEHRFGALSGDRGWESLEPRTPFRAYPRPEKRY